MHIHAEAGRRLLIDGEELKVTAQREQTEPAGDQECEHAPDDSEADCVQTSHQPAQDLKRAGRVSHVLHRQDARRCDEIEDDSGEQQCSGQYNQAGSRDAIDDYNRACGAGECRQEDQRHAGNSCAPAERYGDARAERASSRYAQREWVRERIAEHRLQRCSDQRQSRSDNSRHHNPGKPEAEQDVARQFVVAQHCKIDFAITGP